MNITDIVYVMSFSVLLLSKVCNYKYKLTRDIKFAIADLLFFFTHIAGILAVFSLSMKGLGIGVVSWSFLIIYFFLNHKIVKVYEKKLQACKRRKVDLINFPKELAIEKIENLDRSILLFKNGVEAKKFSGYSHIKGSSLYKSIVEIYESKLQEVVDYIKSDDLPKQLVFPVDVSATYLTKIFDSANNVLLTNSDSKDIDGILSGLSEEINKFCESYLKSKLSSNSQAKE